MAEVLRLAFNCLLFVSSRRQQLHWSWGRGACLQPRVLAVKQEPPKPHPCWGVPQTGAAPGGGGSAVAIDPSSPCSLHSAQHRARLRRGAAGVPGAPHGRDTLQTPVPRQTAVPDATTPHSLSSAAGWGDISKLLWEIPAQQSGCFPKQRWLHSSPGPSGVTGAGAQASAEPRLWRGGINTACPRADGSSHPRSRQTPKGFPNK